MSKQHTGQQGEVMLELWNREPDPCWSCGGDAEARDDIHIRCVDSKGINCEVMGHWFTRKTWNSRASVVAPPGDELTAFLLKVATLPCARIDGDKCAFFEKDRETYCASCHAEELLASPITAPPASTTPIIDAVQGIVESEGGPVPIKRAASTTPVDGEQDIAVRLDRAYIAGAQFGRNAGEAEYQAAIQGRFQDIHAVSSPVAPSPTPEHRALFSELIHIAAELARGDGFLSPCAEDLNPRLKRADILKTAERQEERLKGWACRVRRVADQLSAAPPSTQPSARAVEQCAATCKDFFSGGSCDMAHGCVLDAGHPFDPLHVGGGIHEFETHPTTVKPRAAIPPASPSDAQTERETLIYWLLRAYQSGHREGWESGASTDETMDGICSVLANRGYDPNLSDIAKELLEQKARY